MIPDFNPLPAKEPKIITDATFVIINDVKYTIGDKVWHGLDFKGEDETLFDQGFVAFGEFGAEIYSCYGFYVADKDGNQVSEGGLTEFYKIIQEFR